MWAWTSGANQVASLLRRQLGWRSQHPITIKWVVCLRIPSQAQMLQEKVQLSRVLIHFDLDGFDSVVRHLQS